eukprot:g55625.t1
MNPVHAILGRADTMSQTYDTLSAWVRGQLQSMTGPNFQTHYTHRGIPVCRVMWMRVYGIGEKIMHQKDKWDLVYVILILYFVEDCETTADGIWHLQDLQNFPSIAEHVKLKWNEAVQNMKVKWVREGNYAMCKEYGQLATVQKKGFDSDVKAQEWREQRQAHNKVHRANRVGNMHMEYTSQLCTGKDQVFYIMRNCDYNWRKYFKPCVNKGLKHYAQPLAYQYDVGDEQTGYLPKVRYKEWGHAEPQWRGINDDVNGAPLRPYLRPPLDSRPEPLPRDPWVTEDILKNTMDLARKYCSDEEQKWFAAILRDGHLLNPAYLVWDGEEVEGGLPGRPGHFSCHDLARKLWKVQVRVLGPLPDNLWGVPQDRQEKIDREYLS